MDLEARSLQPNVKAMLLAKLREYKSDLNNLKSEVKRMTSVNANAARDDLLESGMADTKVVRPNRNFPYYYYNYSIYFGQFILGILRMQFSGWSFISLTPPEGYFI